MTPRRLAQALALVALAFGAWVAIWFAVAKSEAMEAVAMRARERSGVEAQIRQTETDIEHARKKLAEPRPKPALPVPKTPVEPAKTVMPYGPTDALRDNPALQSLYLKSERSKIRGQYQELFQRLSLSAEQIEAFSRNLVRRREQTMDLNAIAQRQDATERKAIATLRKQAEDEYQQAQKTALGEEGYAAFQEYEKMAGPRDVAGSLAGMLATMDLPLTAQQGTQLAEVIAKAVDSKRAGNRIDLNYADWAAIDREAAKVLTPAQFAAFTTLSPNPGNGSRWLSEFNVVFLAAYEREVPAERRNPPQKQ